MIFYDNLGTKIVRAMRFYGDRKSLVRNRRLTRDSLRTSAKTLGLPHDLPMISARFDSERR